MTEAIAILGEAVLAVNPSAPINLRSRFSDRFKIAFDEAYWAECAPVRSVHDALLIEAADNEVDIAVTTTQVAMAETSRIVLNGFELRAEAKVVRWPERYMDDRGLKMWETVMKVAAESKGSARVADP
jgi:hypothetical protein